MPPACTPPHHVLVTTPWAMRIGAGPCPPPGLVVASDGHAPGQATQAQSRSSRLLLRCILFRYSPPLWRSATTRLLCLHSMLATPGIRWVRPLISRAGRTVGDDVRDPLLISLPTWFCRHGLVGGHAAARTAALPL